MNRLQRETLNRYHINPVYNLGSSIKDVSDKAVIKKYFHLFNDLFFFGSLNSRCTLTMLNQDWRDSKKKAGTTLEPSFRQFLGLAPKI
jgi:hypothetical protein